MWSGNVADYFLFRIFGCSCYIQVSDGKLDRRARKCIFLGYAQGEQSYRLWCLELNSLIVSKEVIFYESLVLLARSVCGNVHTSLNGV